MSFQFRLQIIKLLALFAIIILNIVLIEIYMRRNGACKTTSDSSTASNRFSKLIFVGGMPRSGTTLMRVMLDAHPSVRCGEESRIIPKLLKIGALSRYNQFELGRLKEAKISPKSIDEAISSAILQIITEHGQPAERLCNKDPLMMLYLKYSIELFPNSKLILMLRDGRASVHSIIRRRVTIEGFPAYNYREYLKRWNITISNMYYQCLRVGEEQCLTVHYEKLVIHTSSELKRILKFLEVPWDESVLHHSDFIGTNISLSKVEKSSDQVAKPVYRSALDSWVGQIPDDVVREMPEIAPMLKILGYDPLQNPPNYARLFG